MGKINQRTEHAVSGACAAQKEPTISIVFLTNTAEMLPRFVCLQPHSIE